MLGAILAAALVLAARAEDGRARPGADSSRLFRRLGEPCDAWCRATTALEPSSGLVPASALERVRAMASRPGALNPTTEPTLAWRVFAAPRCCGSCCYVAACFPCYRLPLEYVEERLAYLAAVTGTAPPAPPAPPAIDVVPIPLPAGLVPGGDALLPGADDPVALEENAARRAEDREGAARDEPEPPPRPPWRPEWTQALLKASSPPTRPQ
jgi:hypothetical protein